MKMNYLKQKVLVLNRLWQAVNTCSIKRALTLLADGRAEVVMEMDGGAYKTYGFQDWCDFSKDSEENMLSTIHFKIRLPKVILLLAYDQRPKREIKLTRQNIFFRDKDTCQYCGVHFNRVDLNLDHVKPRDAGGLSTWENLVCSCIPCNSHKANRTPEQAGMKLIRKPKKPNWAPFLHITFGSTPDRAWQHFVDVSYWNTELVA